MKFVKKLDNVNTIAPIIFKNHFTFRSCKRFKKNRFPINYIDEILNDFFFANSCYIDFKYILYLLNSS